MKTSCSSWSYHRTINAGKMDQMSWLAECASLGLDGVELLTYHFPSTDVDYLKKVRKFCTDNFLSIAIVSAGGHLTNPDDAKRAADVEEIGKWIKVGAYLGAPRVRFFAGSGPELEAGGDELYKKVVAASKEVVAMGEAEGITMAMENHGDTTAEQLLALAKDIDSEYFKLTLDTGNFPPHSTFGPHTLPSIEKTAHLASIVHAKFFNVLEDGRDADFDWEAIHGILQKVNFRGFLSIEYEGKDDNEVETIRRIVKYLKTLR